MRNQTEQFCSPFRLLVRLSSREGEEKKKKNLQNNPQKPPVKLKQDKFSSDVTRIINNAHLSEHSRAS